MTFRPLQPTPTTTPQGGGFRALSSTPAQQPLGQLQQKTPLIEKSKGLGFGIGLGVAPIGLGGVSSFLGRASDKVKEATEKKSIIESDYKSGKQGAIQTNIQRAGAGVGLAYGIASELPIIKQGFELFGKGINKLSETAPIEKAGDFISPVTGFGLGLWDKLTPQQKRTAGAGAEILSSIPFGTPAKTAGIASKVAKPVIKGTEVIKDTVRTSLKGYGDNIVEKQISKDLDTLLSKKGLQTQIKNTEKKNINITEHLSDREIFEGLKLEKGKINPTKSINVIDDRIDTILDAKSKMLPEIDRIVPKTPKDVIYRKAIADLKGTPADNLKTIKQIEVQLAPLPETLSVSAIDKFRALFRKSARDARGLQKDGSHYSALENATRDTVFDITDDLPMSNSNEFASLNTYVKDMIGTKEFIEKSLTGRVFDKGGMSYLFGKGIGAVAGSKFGIFGAIAGSEVGGTITSILASNHLGSSIKLKIIKNMTDDPRIIKEVERLLSDLKNYEPNFPLLGEGAIPLGAKQPLESSVKAIPATELKPDRLRLKEGATLLPPREASGVKAITPKTGLVGQDPKTGRFFGTLLGGEKTQSLGIPSISRQNTANTTITTVPKKVIPNTTIKTSTKSNLQQEAKITEKVKTILSSVGNDLDKISIVGSVAKGKLKPNDIDILITPTDKKLLSDGARSINKILTRELQEFFPDIKVSAFTGILAPKLGKSISLSDFFLKANKTDNLLTEAKKFKSADEFYERMPSNLRDEFRNKGIKGKEQIENWWKENNIPTKADTLEGAMQHRPSKSGVASNIPQDSLPDFYERPNLYDYGGKEYSESIDILQKIRNKPNSTITIYRASPKNELRTGDWITLSKEKGRLESLTENVPVQEFKVKVKEIQLAGDDITEFGYWGKPIKDIYNKAKEIPVEPKGKVSGVAKSIEAKAIEQGLIEKGFDKLAEYDPVTIKEQSKLVSDIMSKDIEMAKRIALGQEPLPKGVKGASIFQAMEDYAMKTKDGKLALDIANSPIATEISTAGQTLRLSAERTQDTATAKIREIKKEREKAVEKKLKGKKPKKVKDSINKSLKEKSKKAKPNKYDLANLLDKIVC